MARKKNEFSILDRIADTLEGMASGERKSTASAITKLGMLNRIADALDEIAESGSGGGGSGGGDIMVVHISYDGESDSYSADKQFDEILEAIQNGQFVVATDIGDLQDPEEFGARYFYVNNADSSYIEFSNISFYGNSGNYTLNNSLLAITPEGINTTEIIKNFSDNN